MEPVENIKELILFPHPTRAKYSRMWHSTHLANLPGIFEKGLYPRSGSCKDGYGGMLHWDEAIFLWPHPRFAWGWASEPIEVVVEVALPDDITIYYDPARYRDCEMGNSYYITEHIPPSDIVVVGPHCLWPQDKIKDEWWRDWRYILDEALESLSTHRSLTEIHVVR